MVRVTKLTPKTSSLPLVGNLHTRITATSRSIDRECHLNNDKYNLNKIPWKTQGSLPTANFDRRLELEQHGLLVEDFP